MEDKISSFASLPAGIQIQRRHLSFTLYFLNLIFQRGVDNILESVCEILQQLATPFHLFVPSSLLAASHLKEEREG